MVDKKMIWVVDDDPAIRELVTFMVTEAGYEVDAFASGAEVLASSGGPPDAILLDLMMPGVDGRGGSQGSFPSPSETSSHHGDC